MGAIYSTSREYSKAWCADHPVLFTASVLELCETHPDELWVLSMKQTKGFITVHATKKESDTMTSEN